jgi:hypothetical protein
MRNSASGAPLLLCQAESANCVLDCVLGATGGGTLSLVWRPADFETIEAAIGVISESADLDFKGELSKPTDIAKDIASMSIQGGVIAYGIAEDPETTIASAINPIQLHQVPEKIQNIVDTAIWPSPSINIQVLTRQPGDHVGVVLVTVEPSPLAPHFTHERFPARSGTTTRSLTEREISALYDQRRAVFAVVGDNEIVADFLQPTGAPPAGNGFGGIGILRLLVAPFAPVRHPEGLRLARPLADAVSSAKESTGVLLPSHDAVAFDWMEDWRPRGTIGWEAGGTYDDFERLNQGRTSAAACTHDISMSFYATMRLTGENDVRCAFEQRWAAETVAFLSVAMHFFKQIQATSLLRVELSLQGLENAVSYAVSRGRINDLGQLRAADNNYRERTRTSTTEIADEPIKVARRLLDRLFVSFVPENMDTFDRLQTIV